MVGVLVSFWLSLSSAPVPVLLSVPVLVSASPARPNRRRSHSGPVESGRGPCRSQGGACCPSCPSSSCSSSASSISVGCATPVGIGSGPPWGGCVGTSGSSDESGGDCGPSHVSPTPGCSSPPGCSCSCGCCTWNSGIGVGGVGVGAGTCGGVGGMSPSLPAATQLAAMAMISCRACQLIRRRAWRLPCCRRRVVLTPFPALRRRPSAALRTPANLF